eukprot:TRINITY_DN1692_c0_g1_i5.p2 TRINITY_DN1692_c0_g1~~TRINITY_DN1692_c0_g1_i5.p2  ORF type:complete len:214 (+),score=41.38 TRINITY_DN1692_c0_g1_i5:1-642(+)
MDSVRSVTICTRTHFAEVFRSCEKAEHTASAAAAAKLSPTGRASPVAGSSRDDGLGVGGRNEATVSSAAGGVGGGGGGGGIGGSGTGGSGSVSGALGSAAKAARARRAGGYRYSFGTSRKTPLALSTKLSSSGSVTRSAVAGAPPGRPIAVVGGGSSGAMGDAGGPVRVNGHVTGRASAHHRSMSAGPLCATMSWPAMRRRTRLGVWGPLGVC